VVLPSACFVLLFAWGCGDGPNTGQDTGLDGTDLSAGLDANMDVAASETPGGGPEHAPGREVGPFLVDGAGEAGQPEVPESDAALPGGGVDAAWVDAHPGEVNIGVDGPGPILRLLAGSAGGPGEADGLGSAARFNAPLGMATDGKGNLFVADSKNHVIRKIVMATGEVTTFAGLVGQQGYDDGIAAAARFNQPTGVATDPAGNLYVTDTGNNAIRKIVIATATVSTFAGSGDHAPTTWSYPYFARPDSIVYDGMGNLVVAESGNFALRKIEVATGAINFLAGWEGRSGYDDGSGAGASFCSPNGVASDGGGRVFVADSCAETIRQVIVATGAVTTLAGSPGRPGRDDGAGGAARFSYPTGVWSDGAGAVYVADSGNWSLRRLDVASGAVSTLVGWNGVVGQVDCTLAADGLLFPAGITGDGLGNLFISDSHRTVTEFGKQSIRQVVIATGAITTLAGPVGSTGCADGTGSAARFQSPQGVASDGMGNLFVADYNQHTIRKIVIATGAVSTLAGSPARLGSADGIGAAATFYGPVGVASDGAGNVFVTEYYNLTVRQIVVATGAVSTLAGLAQSPGTTDGTGTNARFRSLGGVASDGQGNLFVADGNRIRQIAVETAEVTTLAGGDSTITCDSTRDGLGTAARFSSLDGLVYDGAGKLFAADNRLIREIDIATGAVTTVAGGYDPDPYACTPLATHTYRGPVDAIGSDARFGLLRGLAYDGAGNLFVADSSYQLIRKTVIATGAVSTVAGSSGHPGLVLGPMPAGFANIAGLAFVSPGQLFIADEGAYSVLVLEF
jgi:hypothetical protein